jgi:hypothetical protein
MDGNMELANFHDTGKLDIKGIKRIWSKIQLALVDQLCMELKAQEWQQDIAIMDLLGVDLATWTQYLHHSPSFEAFENWLADKHGGSIPGSIKKPRTRI